MDNVNGFKRFLIALLSLVFLSVITIVLLYCMITKITNSVETLPIVSVAVMAIGGVAGAYLGVQSITDYFKNKKAIPSNGQAGPDDKPGQIRG
jgi:hypothetical protein